MATSPEKSLVQEAEAMLEASKQPHRDAHDGNWDASCSTCVAELALETKSKSLVKALLAEHQRLAAENRSLRKGRAPQPVSGAQEDAVERPCHCGFHDPCVRDLRDGYYCQRARLVAATDLREQSERLFDVVTGCFDARRTDKEIALDAIESALATERQRRAQVEQALRSLRHEVVNTLDVASLTLRRTLGAPNVELLQSRCDEADAALKASEDSHV